MTKLASLGLVAMLGLSLGCDNPDAGRPPGLVAVVDMNRLKQETGFWEVRGNELKKVQDLWETQFTAMQQSFSARLQAESKTMGQTPTPEQMAKFDALRTQLGQSIDEAYNAFQIAIQQKDQELHMQFRQKYQEVIILSATEKGLSVVLESGPWIAAASKDCDVTDAALAKIKSSGNTFSSATPAVPGVTPGAAPGIAPGAVPGMAPVPSTGFSGRAFEGGTPGTPPGLAPGMAPGVAPAPQGTPPGMMPGAIPPTGGAPAPAPAEEPAKTQPEPKP